MSFGRRRGRMDVQLAEAATKVLVLVYRDVLVAEEDHLVFQQCVPDLAKGLVVERLGQVDAEDFGADARRQLPNPEFLVAHLVS